MKVFGLSVALSTRTLSLKIMSRIFSWIMQEHSSREQKIIEDCGGSSQLKEFSSKIQNKIRKFRSPDIPDIPDGHEK